MKKEDYPVDIVITWVDGNDPKWLREKNKYATTDEINDNSSGGAARYDDNGLLKFLFRGIEQFAPWVNKIHFVTCGHLPSWLNINNPKLNIVKHSDFIPKEYLPTFNSDPIALNLHRIPGLSEHFIYMNDDMYFISHISKKLFFKNGLPCDMAVQDIVESYQYGDTYYYTLINDLACLNSVVNKKKAIRKHFFKWFNLKYGVKMLIKNALLYKFSCFTGIYEPHTPASYLKSFFVKSWDLFYSQFDKTSKQKIRNYLGCTENVVRFYQLTTGNFYPIDRNKIGRYCNMKQRNLDKIITEQKYKMICINYSDEKSKNKIIAAFNSILLTKSIYEID